KDVYCEKPLTLTIGEGKLITEAVKKYDKVFQVGTQQRSEYKLMFLKAVAIAKSGRLGKKLHALASVETGDQGGPFPTSKPPKTLDWNLWQGQAPFNPYCVERFGFGWFRWWLAYSGGQVTDWGVHHGDIAAWAVGGDQTGPCTIEGKGNFPGLPKGVNFLDLLAGKLKDLPNKFNVAQNFDVNFTFPNGNTVRLYSGRNELIISGEKGKIRVNRGSLTGKPVEEIAASKAERDWLDQEVLKLYKGKKPGNHMQNFFECIRDHSEPQSDVASHVNSVNMCHMANIAMMTGRKLTWDQAAYEFVGDPEANAFINRPQRKGFEIRL
ncbi:MAG: dehydrogenase, partial [Planctomycetia bacterium]